MGSSILPLASVVSTLGGLVFGYELGIISGALFQLRTEFSLSCVQQEVVVSSLLFGALLASTIGGWLIDRHGRRKAILLSNVLILIGSLVLLISSYTALVIGRITVGFAMCISSMSCCIFVSEMVSPDRRGFMVILYEAGITVGILVAYALNYLLSDCRRGWKWMFGFAIFPTLLQLFSVWFLSSSTNNVASYYCQTERVVMSPYETQEADDTELTTSEDSKKVHCDSMYLFQRKDNMRTRTVIGLGLVLFQQFTGQPNILFYASTIFSSVGFQSTNAALLASTGLGFVKVIATLTSMVLSDRVGRRPMLISGCSVMALCLIIIGLFSGHFPVNAKKSCDSVNTTNLPQLTAGNQSVFVMPLDGRQMSFENLTAGNQSVFVMPLDGRQMSFENNTQNLPFGQKPLEPAVPSTVYGTVLNWVILLCMMAVVSAYSVGFGPMTWLLLSEIFPTAVRGRAFAFTNCFNWAANLLVTFTFLNVVDTIGLSKVFFLYGMTAVTAAVFFYFMLPETKGKTLEEIDKELRLPRFDHSDGCCGCITLKKRFSPYQRIHCQLSIAE